MSLPELLMLDKPSLGLAPIIVGELFESSRATNARGIARKRRDSEGLFGSLAIEPDVASRACISFSVSRTK